MNDIQDYEVEEKDATSADALIELITLLKSVDPNSPLAELNANTISDNNGGRIEL